MLLGFILALAAGALVGVQNVFNGRVNGVAGSWATTTLVLGLGFAASLTLGLVFEGKRLFALESMETWFAFSGFIGVGVVFCLVRGIQRLGPTVAVAAALSSQLLFGLLWDSFGWFGLRQVPFTAKQAVGALVMIVGIALLKLGGQARERAAAGGEASELSEASKPSKA